MRTGRVGMLVCLMGGLLVAALATPARATEGVPPGPEISSPKASYVPRLPLVVVGATLAVAAAVIGTEAIRSPTQPAAQPASVGRIVHYVLAEGDETRNPGEHRPAIIVRVWSETCVQLQVFMDGANDADRFGGTNGTMWVTSVSRDEEAKSGRTWHWPERV